MICDSRFESQIAIAIKSRDSEHLAGEYCSFAHVRPQKELAGSEKLCLAPKVLQNLWKFCMRALQQVCSTMQTLPLNPPAEPQRFRRILGGRGGSVDLSFEDRLFSSNFHRIDPGLFRYLPEIFWEFCLPLHTKRLPN